MGRTFAALYTSSMEAVVVLGEAKLPKYLHFLVVIAGKAGNDHQKRMLLGWPLAFQPSQRE